MSKRRTLILGLLTILTLNNCVNEIKENDWVEDKLKSKVLSYTETSFIAKDSFNIITKGERKRESFNTDFQKKYNENGNLIELHNYNSDISSLNEKLKYEYDKNGLISAINNYNLDGSLNKKSKYEYDKNGLLTTIKNYNSNGSLNNISSYKYNDRKEMTELDNRNGTVIKFKYYENGDIEKNWITGNLLTKYIFKYDKNENVIESIAYSQDDNISTYWKMKYNELGHIVEKQRYDEDDNLIREVKYKYDYDKNNNWTKRIDFSDNFPLYILEREYEYYK